MPLFTAASWLARKGASKAKEALQNEFLDPQKGIRRIAPFFGKIIKERLGDQTSSQVRVSIASTVLYELLEELDNHTPFTPNGLAAACEIAASKLREKARSIQHGRD